MEIRESRRSLLKEKVVTVKYKGARPSGTNWRSCKKKKQEPNDKLDK